MASKKTTQMCLRYVGNIQHLHDELNNLDYLKPTYVYADPIPPETIENMRQWFLDNPRLASAHQADFEEELANGPKRVRRGAYSLASHENTAELGEQHWDLSVPAGLTVKQQKEVMEAVTRAEEANEASDLADGWGHPREVAAREELLKRMTGESI